VRANTAGGVSCANPWANLGISTYNSLQSTLTRRFSQGLTFTLSYTFSKQLDDLVASPRNPYNNALEKGPGVIDHPHVGALIFVYHLPFGAGHKLNSGSKIVSSILSNWQVSGLATYTSGSPLVTSGTCTSGGILGTCYPNYNPAFSGSVWINGDFGSGGKNVSASPYLDKNALLIRPPTPSATSRAPLRTGCLLRTTPMSTSAFAASFTSGKPSASPSRRMPST
jgi:hypothetical protein